MDYLPKFSFRKYLNFALLYSMLSRNSKRKKKNCCSLLISNFREKKKELKVYYFVIMAGQVVISFLNFLFLLQRIAVNVV